MAKATRRARRSLGKREKHRRYRHFLGDVIRLYDRGYKVPAIVNITGRSTPTVQRAVDALEKLLAEKKEADEEVRDVA